MLRLHFNPWSTCHSSAIVFRCQVGTGTAIATEDMNFVTISDQGLNGVPSKILHTVQLGWEWITRQQHTHLFSWILNLLKEMEAFFPWNWSKNETISYIMTLQWTLLKSVFLLHPTHLYYSILYLKWKNSAWWRKFPPNPPVPWLSWLRATCPTLLQKTKAT